MRVLLVINGAPYGSEQAYNALRLGMALQREQQGVEVALFLLADAVGCALPGQTTPQGYYNVERMLKAVISKGSAVKACGSCLEARGLSDRELVQGVEVSSMSELAQWVVDADRVLTF